MGWFWRILAQFPFSLVRACPTDWWTPGARNLGRARNVAHRIAAAWGPFVSSSVHLGTEPRSDSIRRDVRRQDRADPAGRSNRRRELRILDGVCSPNHLHKTPPNPSPLDHWRAEAQWAPGRRTEKTQACSLFGSLRTDFAVLHKSRSSATPFPASTNSKLYRVVGSLAWRRGRRQHGSSRRHHGYKLIRSVGARRQIWGLHRQPWEPRVTSSGEIAAGGN
jgi:hypothetical protein